MQFGGQVSAAIEVVADIVERHRPASIALNDWGRSHRFAGSRDRSVIGTLVYDVLRRKASLAWRMDNDSPRSLVLAALRFIWPLALDEIEIVCDGSIHAPNVLIQAERRPLSADPAILLEAPEWVRADIPEWLYPKFAAAFGEDAIAEGQALANRAPIDLRVNTLKADRARVLKALDRYGAQPTAFSPVGLRIPAAGPLQKNPNVEAEAGHGRGWFEVQDEASQIATFLSGAGPREQVLDLCAGSGGKTLGLAALMQNTGQIHAYDSDKLRLRPIVERLKRAGARNVQVLQAGRDSVLEPLRDKMDMVLVDAPCSGSGVWRRRPDSKWRLSREALNQRVEEQRQILELATSMVKPGGRLVYATCSVLPAENIQQVEWFQSRFPAFRPLPWRELWESFAPGTSGEATNDGFALQLTPAKPGTDGFFVAVHERSA